MPNPPPTRKASVYSSEELAQLNRYRDEYMTYKSSMERTDFLKKKLGPEFFNWCSMRGKPIGEPGSTDFKTAVKQLSNWVYNTWRLPKKESRHRGRVRVIDVARATMAAEMDAEVKKILKKEVERGSLEHFQQQNKALSNIVRNLPAAEYARLEAMAREWNEKGSPPEEQRRTAEKHGWKRVEQDDVHRWRDMGMVCLTFMAYHAADGDLLVLWCGFVLRLTRPQQLTSSGSQDNIAKNMGAVATPFRIEYEALCTEVKKKLVNYVTMVERSLQPGIAEYVEQTERDPRPDLQVILDEEGFPHLPEEPSFPQKHEELVRIVRKFLNAHYRLASGYKERAAPYGALKGDNRKFVDPEYVPSGLTLQEPGNMKMDELKKLLAFWRERETIHGVQNTFRFAQWIRGKDGMVAAVYSNLPHAAAPPRTRRKKSKSKRETPGSEQVDQMAATVSAAATPSADKPDESTPPPTLPDPPIDPVLLKIDALRTPQPLERHGEQAAMDMNTSSTLAVEATPVAGTIDQEPTTRIGFEVMQRLRERGYPDVASDNGPAEGNPEYIVPASALRLLDPQSPSAGSEEAAGSAPRKRKRNIQTVAESGKRSSRNSNALMFEEAQGILTGPSAHANSAMGTRTRATAGVQTRTAAGTRSRTAAEAHGSSATGTRTRNATSQTGGQRSANKPGRKPVRQRR